MSKSPPAKVHLLREHGGFVRPACMQYCAGLLSRNPLQVTCTKCQKFIEENKMKVYRVTWRHEVIFQARGDEEAQAQWESVQLGYLAEMEGRSTIMSHEFVERVTFECLSDDYREVKP
jgi:hypothetical protein